MLDNDATTQIYTTATERQDGLVGNIKCAYVPCDLSGEGEPDDDLLVDEPNELLNKEIFFRVEVDNC